MELAQTDEYTLLRDRSYLTWLISDTSKGLAASLFGFAVPLMALIITDDPAQAGVIGAVGMAVRTLVTLGGGILADRYSRIGLMILGSVIGVLLSGAFVVLAAADALTFAALMGLVVLLALRGGLFDVAGESALKEVVPDSAMGQAQAANQARDAALQLAGGPIGGALLTVGGWLVGAAMLACHLVAGVSAALLPQRRQAVVRSEHQPAWVEMKEGFTWLFARSDLSGVILVSTVINLGFNAAVSTVIYSLQQSGYSALTIGTLSSVIGAAMLVAALASPWLVVRVGAGWLVICGLSLGSAGVVALTMVNAPVEIAAVLGVSVILIPALNAALLGYFMVAVPAELLGRANSITAVLGMGAMPLAPLIAGFGLKWVGRSGALIMCAAICLFACLLAVSNRALRDLPKEAGWVEHAARYVSSV